MQNQKKKRKKESSPKQILLIFPYCGGHLWMQSLILQQNSKERWCFKIGKWKFVQKQTKLFFLCTYLNI